MYAFRLLKDKVCKSCGKVYTKLPKDFTPWDSLDAVMFQCPCIETSLFVKNDDIDTSAEACECDQCVNSETPCFEIGQCLKDGQMCPGCKQTSFNGWEGRD